MFSAVEGLNFSAFSNLGTLGFTDPRQKPHAKTTQVPKTKRCLALCAVVLRFHLPCRRSHLLKYSAPLYSLRSYNLAN